MEGSPQQSQFGSPHGQAAQDPRTGGQSVPSGVPQGNGSTEMVELMRMMASATQAATAAAQSNVQGGSMEKKKQLGVLPREQGAGG